MKKNKTSSKLHIAFVIVILASLACFITALCLCDYNFDSPFKDVWQANTAPFILFGASVLLDLILVISAIILRVKNDELTRSEVGLAFMIAIVLLLEVVLCAPIFIAWIVETIHDAVANSKRERI